MAFAVSATASNWNRLSKPFNPLLGETYELDRSVDLKNIMKVQIKLLVVCLYIGTSSSAHPVGPPPFPVWVPGLRIDPLRLLAGCRKRQPNQLHLSTSVASSDY